MRLARPEGSQWPLGAHQAQRARPWPSSAPWRAHTPPPLPDHRVHLGRPHLPPLPSAVPLPRRTHPSQRDAHRLLLQCVRLAQQRAGVRVHPLEPCVGAAKPLGTPTAISGMANKRAQLCQRLCATSVTTSIREVLRHTCDADRAHIDACGRSSAGVGMPGVTAVGLTVKCEAPTADRVSLMQSAQCACTCRRERWGECVRWTVRSRGAFAPDRLVVDWCPIEPVARSLLRCCQQRRAPLSLHDVQSTK